MASSISPEISRLRLEEQDLPQETEKPDAQGVQEQSSEKQERNKELNRGDFRRSVTPEIPCEEERLLRIFGPTGVPPTPKLAGGTVGLEDNGWSPHRNRRRVSQEEEEGSQGNLGLSTPNPVNGLHLNSLHDVLEDLMRDAAEDWSEWVLRFPMGEVDLQRPLARSACNGGA
eukprot:TRINITY_DN45962_c0_g1_i1.p1 TRINITY_DN45962_c0_g1~~TRINITY_DN45962_c0_g1_i1.p1  ORF type:complete len:172 (-),score=39.69 TRINITY_DN45962_c0_g1_i1:14-529(-)